MLVKRSNFEEVLAELSTHSSLSLDTETTGLRPFHGDRLFSLIIGAPKKPGAPGDVTPYYFNFQPYEGLDPDSVLLPTHLVALQPLLAEPSRTFYGHNFKFDLSILHQEGLFIGGKVHCTRSIARVECNYHMKYDLASCAERIGFAKDETVETYIEEHGLWEWQTVPGKKARDKHKFYNRVPFDIIVPYGERDAEITYRLGRHQEETLQRIADETLSSSPALPTVQNIVKNEARLTNTFLRMERVGVRIDRPYCVRAARFEVDRAEKAVGSFKAATGEDFKASGKLFETIFASERDKWAYTEKGNPSLGSEALVRFENPAAKCILEYRDAKSRADFYHGFLYHADQHDILHANFNSDGAKTGRTSSSDPNFQTLTSEEDAEDLAHEFVVRRAIIPRPGFVLFMPDFDQMEYRMMFDYACIIAGYETELVKKIKYEGLDPHQATADLVTALGTPLTRKKAKNGNFALLYGSGDTTLAETIKGSVEDARALRTSIFSVAPEIKKFIGEVMRTVRQRGFIRNWAGRRTYFPDLNYAYRGPNSLIQGGTADVNKIALNLIDEYLLGKKSKLVLTIHDENPIEVHESEIDEVPREIVRIMESVYPAKYLPLTAGAEWSPKSLADKLKGYPA